MTTIYLVTFVIGRHEDARSGTLCWCPTEDEALAVKARLDQDAEAMVVWCRTWLEENPAPPAKLTTVESLNMMCRPGYTLPPALEEWRKRDLEERHTWTLHREKDFDAYIANKPDLCVCKYDLNYGDVMRASYEVEPCERGVP